MAIRKKPFTRKRASQRKKRSVAKGDKVSDRRVATITKIAKKVVNAEKELKFTQFEQMNTTTYNIQSGVRFTVIHLNRLAACYPAQGDNRNQRDGVKYKILGFNVFYSVMCENMNINSPLELRIARINPRQNIRDGNDTDGIEYLRYYYPQCDSSDLVTFTAGVPVVVGQMDPNVGRVVKSWKIRPDTKVTPGNYKFHMATPTDVNVANEMKYYKVFIPFKQNVVADGGSAEIPTRSPKFVLMARCSQQNTTSWDLQYVYTQCVFKDV